MENTIFYSWQSDLPNNSNRGFLETCLNNVPKELVSIAPFSIEFTIDRDTKDETGTPDITQSIFKKIDKTKIFIADISIINTESSGRKTPNPNVLIELGFAAKSIGWERVICIYNLDYGSLSDLPFDLRQRRPLTYSLKDQNKSELRKKITKVIAKTILKLHDRGLIIDNVDDYLKVQVDTEILTIINHLSKIVFGYSKNKSLDTINQFMNLKDEDISESLKNDYFLGFQIFKKWEVNESKLREIVDKTISSSYHGKELASIIIELMRWTGSFDKFNRYRTNPDLFQLIEEESKEYKAISGLTENPKNLQYPNRFILLKKVDEDNEKVQDFGDFIEQDKIDGLIRMFKFNPKYIESYTNTIRQFIKIAEKWLDNTNGEFIIENIKQFEIKTVSNK